MAFFDTQPLGRISTYLVDTEEMLTGVVGVFGRDIDVVGEVGALLRRTADPYADRRPTG